MDETEAAALMRAIAAGQEAALGRLIAALGPPVTRLATRMLGSAADGDEVAQDCFVAVWRNAPAWDAARGSAQGWVWRIAANLCRDRLRRARLRAILGWGRGLDDTGDAAADAPGTEATVAARQRLAQVRQAMDTLPDRQRLALLLAAVAGLDTPEIAAIMGASRGSVEQLLVRARRTLRETLGERDAG